MSWYSSDEEIVRVTPDSEDSHSAMVKAIGPGTAAIVAQTGDGERQSCAVTVYDAPTGIAISMTDLTLAKPKDGEPVSSVEPYAKQLYAVIEPSTADQRVTWSVNPDDGKVATVNQTTGLVTALGPGTATITATSTADPTKKDTCTVTVREPVEKILLESTNEDGVLVLGKENENQLTLTATVWPRTATNQTVYWYSSAPSVAAVSPKTTENGDEATVTPLKPGTAVIIAVADDNGVTASYPVTVRYPVAGVTLNQESLIMGRNTQFGLTATVNSEEPADQRVTWESSNRSVATVENGLVTAVGLGTATITATSVADPTKTGTCDVTVGIAVESVALDTTLGLQEGQTKTLTATITPTNAKNQDVTWSSTNENVAEVDDKGVVTAKEAGTATILVTTADGGHTAACTVTVQPVVKSVELDETSMNIGLNDQKLRTLTATVKPAGAVDLQEIEFEITGEGVIELAGSGSTRTVIPLQAGTAAVTAIVTTKDGKTITSGACKVNVSKTSTNYAKLSIKSLCISEDCTYNTPLTVTIVKDLVDITTGFTTVWSSSDPGVATVDNGTVKGLQKGTALITAKVTENSTGQVYTASCAVTVKPTPVEKVTLSSYTLAFDLGDDDAEQSFQLSAKIEPGNANQEVIWYSSNVTVAEVSPDGTVTAKSAGTATISATAKSGGSTATCKVTVTGRNALALDKTTLSLAYAKDKPEAAELTAILDPSIADLTVEWKVESDGDVVEVEKKDSSGRVATVTAKSAGTAKITASVTRGGDESEDKKTFTAECVVTVRAAVTKLTLSEKEITLAPEEIHELTTTVEPEGVDAEITWDSFNKDVATVKDGHVKALKPGRAVIIAATADGAADACVVTVLNKVTSVKLNETELNLTKGDRVGLVAIVNDGVTDYVDTRIEWETSASGKVNVKDGLIEALGVTAEGETVIITAKSVANPALYAECKVTVKEKTTPVTDVKLDKKTLELNTYSSDKKTETLTASFTGNPTDQGVKWESTDVSVATVTEDAGASATVTAVAPGTATIVVTTHDGGYKAICTVKVSGPEVTIKLSKTDLTLVEGRSETLTADVSPEGTACVWKSSNTGVATVYYDGRVNAIKSGKAAITASTEDGKYSATCIVTVEAEPVRVTSVTIIDPEDKAIEMDVGEYRQLSATVDEEATEKTIEWSSNNTVYAEVDKNGIVKAKAPGTATITARAGEASDTCTVTVRNPVVDLTLDHDTLTLAAPDGDGEAGTGQLIATVIPTRTDFDFFNRNVTWISGSDSVVTLNTDTTQSGKPVTVTAVGAGTATIIAVSEDGSHTAVCTVTVPGLTLAGPSALSVGEEAELTAVTTPAGLGEITWEIPEEYKNNLEVTDGKVKALQAKEGKAAVTATLTVGEVSVTATHEITITKNKVTHISMDPTLTIGNLDDTETLTVKVETSGKMDPATELNVECTALDGETQDVVEVSDSSIEIAWDEDQPTGTAEITVTAQKAGKALITVSVGDCKAACVVDVPPVRVTDVKLLKDGAALEPGSKIVLKTDGRVNLTPKIVPEDATIKTVKWLNSDPNVVEVEETTGQVKVKGTGKTTITVVTLDGGNTASCEIIVPEITLSKNKLELYEGETAELFAFLTPAGLEDVQWSWSLGEGENAAATVAWDGTKATVTAKEVGEGHVTITVTADGDEIATETCTVTVKKKAEIKLEQTSLTLTMDVDDEKEKQLMVNEDKSVTWSSSAPNVASVNEETGMVTAAGYGTAVITATAVEGGCTASCVVTVWEKPTGEKVKISKSSLTLGIGDTWALTASAGENENPNVTWSFSNTDETGCIEVTEDGLVTARSPGKATITATFVGGVTVQCEITVLKYKVSDVEAPTMTITDNDGGVGKKVTLSVAEEAGEIYYATDNTADFKKYNDGIPVTVTTTIRAYTLIDGYQSAVVTGYIYIGADADQSRSLLTDSRGNTVDTAAEALAEGSVMANITLTEEAVEAAEKAPDIYLAVYDTRGALIALEKHEVQLSGAGGQVISQIFDLDIPDGTEVGLIRLMVLSKDKVPVMSAGMLSG